MQDAESIKITLFYCFEEKTMKTKGIFTDFRINNVSLALEMPINCYFFLPFYILSFSPCGSWQRTTSMDLTSPGIGTLCAQDFLSENITLLKKYVKYFFDFFIFFL
jgi:hypothetical protein